MTVGSQVRNDGDEDAQVQLTVLATGVTYNSVHQGECQRQMIRVTVAAHEGQQSSDADDAPMFFQTTLTSSTFCFLGHREVLRLRYKDYAECTSEHHLIRVKAFAEAQGQNQPLMTVADVPLSVPELLVQVRAMDVLQQSVFSNVPFL